MKLFKSKKLFMIVVFLGGLLMGALLFWAFSSILDDFSGKNASVNSDYVVVSDAEMIDSITTSRSIAEALTCSTIAIVNLDDGAMQDEKQIYFAKELLSDLDDRFIYTGLEDAKTGMNNGIYAAYLIIPSTFSKNALSLNGTPIRTQIDYEVNERLRNDVKEDTVSNIIKLTNNLNDRLSYMYLSSVMDEFHDAQDKAETIMDNDAKENEDIQAIQPKDLVALVKISDLTSVTYDVEPVNISSFMTTNTDLLDQIDSKYKEYLQQSEVDRKKLIEQSSGLLTEMDNMEGIIAGINLPHDDENDTDIFDEGKNALDEYYTDFNTHQLQSVDNVLNIYMTIQAFLREYETTVALYNEAAKDNISKEVYQSLSNAGMLNPLTDSEQIKNTIKNSLTDNNCLFDGYVLEREEEVIKTKLVEGQPVSLKSILLQAYKPVTEKQQEIDIATVELEEMPQDTPEYEQRQENRRLVASSVLGEPMLFDTSDVMTITNDKIIAPIETNVSNAQNAITNQYATERGLLTEYRTALSEYDPLSYIDNSQIQTISSQMHQNGANLATAISDKEIADFDYVREVYDTSREDLNSLKQDILLAKQQSDKAVSDGLDTLQSTKLINTTYNKQALLNFSQKLPYTRLGSLERTNAYEFMVAPLNIDRQLDGKPFAPMMGIVSDTATDSVLSSTDGVNVDNDHKEDMRLIALIVGGALCIIVVIITIGHFSSKRRRMKEE